MRKLYTYMRAAFPDFHAEINWQLVDGDRVTTYKTYHGTHEEPFLGVAPTHRKIHFETVDVMRVQNGKITDHWGVVNPYAADRWVDSAGRSHKWTDGRQLGDEAAQLMKDPKHTARISTEYIVETTRFTSAPRSIEFKNRWGQIVDFASQRSIYE